jgi:hypothetical protein
MIGKKVVVRSNMSGCWYGTLEARAGTEVRLGNARRLWRWWAAEGVSLSGVATAGLHPGHIDDCRIAVPVETAIVLDVIEILSTTEAAQLSIEAAPALQS